MKNGCPECGCILIELDDEDKIIRCPRCNKVREDLMQQWRNSGLAFPTEDDL